MDDTSLIQVRISSVVRVDSAGRCVEERDETAATVQRGATTHKRVCGENVATLPEQSWPTELGGTADRVE